MHVYTYPHTYIHTYISTHTRSSWKGKTRGRCNCWKEKQQEKPAQKKHDVAHIKLLVLDVYAVHTCGLCLIYMQLYILCASIYMYIYIYIYIITHTFRQTCLGEWLSSCLCSSSTMPQRRHPSISMSCLGPSWSCSLSTAGIFIDLCLWPHIFTYVGSCVCMCYVFMCTEHCAADVWCSHTMLGVYPHQHLSSPHWYWYVCYMYICIIQIPELAPHLHLTSPCWYWYMHIPALAPHLYLPDTDACVHACVHVFTHACTCFGGLRCMRTAFYVGDVWCLLFWWCVVFALSNCHSEVYMELSKHLTWHLWLGQIFDSRMCDILCFHSDCQISPYRKLKFWSWNWNTDFPWCLIKTGWF
jgi:hypothetical protein